ncbi:MAG: MMPL family transporter, partial [Acidimicrobiia bacterium]|nr:MMPL family transporter [Acidimicrobiia bacterium]
ALVSVLAASMLFRMQFNADMASFVLEGNDTGEEFKALQDKYTTADPINVIATLTDGSTYRDLDGIVKLALLTRSLGDVEGVAEVGSVIPDVNPLTGEPLGPESLADLAGLDIGALLAQNPAASLLIDEAATSTLVFVVPGDDSVGAARAVDDVEPPAGMELTFSGNPSVFARVLDQLSLILLVVPPLVMILLIVTFYATIGDRRLSALAIVPAVLGSLWTFGLIFGLGREVDIVTVIVPIFVIVMGSADGLHFVTHFQQEASEPDPVKRTASALRHVGIPMILTTVSTAAGFLSLLATDVQPIQQLGLFAAIGIGFAGVISFFSLPALITHFTIEPLHHDALIGPRVTRGLRRLVRTRVPALVVTGVLLALAVIGIPRLEVNSDQLFFFKDDDPVRLAFEKTEELFGGATPLAGEFVYDPGAGAEQLDAIRTSSARLESLPGIRTVFSLVDVVETVPPTQAEALLSGQIELPVGDMVSEDGLRFMVLPADFTTDDLEAWLDFADGEPTIRTLTGMPVVWDEVARLVLNAQVTSLIAAFILVTIMLFAAYRRIRETLVSLVPIALTVASLLGFIALSGIQLNLMTAVSSSIVLGVGIDYAIHYVAAIDLARREGPGYVLRAIDRAGRPIVANALGIAVALTALWVSPLKSHHQVSMIMWVAMAAAALAALLVIPAFLDRDSVSPD